MEAHVFYEDLQTDEMFASSIRSEVLQNEHKIYGLTCLPIREWYKMSTTWQFVYASL